MNTSRFFFLCILFLANGGFVSAQKITAAGQPAQLDIRVAGENSIRITLKPLSFKENFPFTPAVIEKAYPAPAISLQQISKPVRKKVGNLNVEVSPSPLRVGVTNARGQSIQQLVFDDEGNLSFQLNDQPVLGMGEGGPRPQRGTNWRTQQIQFDRRGIVDSMQPRWQADTVLSRPVVLNGLRMEMPSTSRCYRG